ncbi:MAG: (d)CMP kinase [Candidatus Marinimicrobia bacterium]|nr:(d)CMP kinase [Candidatus Neomarinimicrobiota bacterium]
MTLTIAIDGPSASGKSTVSKRVAEELGFVYVDSGSFYRATTWHALRQNVSLQEPEAVLDLVTHSDWSLRLEQHVVRILVDGQDPGAELRSAAVRESVSDVAAMPPVRQFINNLLRSTTQFGSVVMEGRDIGSVVFPEALFKFYLDAAPEERARRRHGELRAREQVDVNQVLEALNRRDRKDSTRQEAPLQIALGARVIDSTAWSIEQTVSHIIQEVRAGTMGAPA